MNVEVWILLYAAIMCLTAPSFIHLTKSFVKAETSAVTTTPSDARILAVAASFALLWLPLLVFVLLAGAYKFFTAPLKKEKDNGN